MAGHHDGGISTSDEPRDIRHKALQEVFVPAEFGKTTIVHSLTIEIWENDESFGLI